MNFSYDFTDKLQVTLEGINLLGEDHREYRRLEGMTVSATNWRRVTPSGRHTSSRLPAGCGESRWTP